jgi:hypothetical protein
MIASLLLSLALSAAPPSSGLASTPPMGFNTWNKFKCSISGAVLMEMANLFETLGLQAAGYEYINSDDCWMDLERAASPNGTLGAGPQVPNATKFPQGMRAVADYIHGKGLKIGLYTARAPKTCAGFAGSCHYEHVDAAQWANWTIDYMKDDSCGGCGSAEDDYTVMQAAIRDVGSNMVLTIEGAPPIKDVYTGIAGNARRVGHDISPFWASMISLVDLGAGLWPYAHNGSLTTVKGGGGFWNDLDMLELGNGAFIAGNSELSAANARSHFSIWAVMKAVLLLGCDLSCVDPATLAIMTNAEAIAVNQDSWGQQARRIAVKTPKDARLASPDHAIAMASKCDATNAMQTWRLAKNGTNPAHLYVVDGEGQAWCLHFGAPMLAVPCDGDGPVMNDGSGWELEAVGQPGAGEYNLMSLNDHLGLAILNAFGGSGPVPHSRWLTNGNDAFVADAAALASAAGGTLRAAATDIYDDDNVGGVRVGGEFCLEIASGSTLETWAGQLSPDPSSGASRWAVALFNRSPSMDVVGLEFAQLPGRGAATAFVVHDVWHNTTDPTSAADYLVNVAAHDTALLIVTQAQ